MPNSHTKQNYKPLSEWFKLLLNTGAKWLEIETNNTFVKSMLIKIIQLHVTVESTETAQFTAVDYKKLILSFLIIVLHKSETTQAKTPYFQAIQNWNNDHTY